MLSGCVKAPKAEAVIEIFGLNCYFGWVLTNLSINPMAAFETRRHESRVLRDTLDHWLDNPHRVRPENLNNLCGYLLVEHRPCEGVKY